MTLRKISARIGLCAAGCLTLSISLGLVYPSTAFGGTNQLFEEFGVGPRDGAMGNAGAALGQDYSAVYYNPAGLAFQKGHHAVFGWKAIYKELYLEIETTPGHNYAETYPDGGVLLIALTTDFNFEGRFSSFLTERFAVGLVLGLGDYLKSFTIYADPNTPYMYRYNDRNAALLPLFFSASFKLFDWMSFGMGGVTAPSDTYTDVTAKTEIQASDQSFETNQGILSRTFSKVEPSLGLLARAPAFGDPTALRFGLVWRDEVSTVDGSGRIRTETRLVTDSGGTVLELPSTDNPLRSLTGFSPMAVTLGAGLALPRDSVQVDVNWRRWSELRHQTEDYPDPRFRDRVDARFGYEHVFDPNVDWAESIALRGGYYFQPSPAPDQSGPLNILDNDKHVVTGGFGIEYYDPTELVLLPMSLDVSYQLHALVERITENDRDPDWHRIRTGGQIHQFAFTVSIQF